MTRHRPIKTKSIHLRTRYGLRGLLAAAAFCVAPALVFAQALNLGTAEKPIEIYAEDGVEWQQDNLVFLARGNARAVRGKVQVLGDQLTAFYSELPDGTTDIYRLDADGKVRIKSTDQTVFGNKAVYDVGNAILTVTGNGPKLVTPTDTIKARDQLEYWEKRQMAVARGDAVALREDREVRGDVLAAFFREEKNGETKVYRVEAFDDVVVITQRDKAFGDRGVYNVETGIATLTGAVRIERGKNTLRGCSAVVDLNTGISKLKSCSDGRVSGELQPKKKREK